MTSTYLVAAEQSEARARNRSYRQALRRTTRRRMTRHRLNMDRTHFETLISKYPVLSEEQGQLRPNVHFRGFESEPASTICGASYIIPFVSDSQCLVTRRENGKWVLPGRHTRTRRELGGGRSSRAAGGKPGASWGNSIRSGCITVFPETTAPRLPHFPHPEHVRVVSWADVVGKNRGQSRSGSEQQDCGSSDRPFQTDGRAVRPGVCGLRGTVPIRLRYETDSTRVKVKDNGRTVSKERSRRCCSSGERRKN